MGYGLTDLQCVKGKIVDPRINQDGWLFADEDEEEKWSMREFKESVRQELILPKQFGIDHDRNDKTIYLNYCTEVGKMYDYIIHEPESGLNNVLLLIPPTQPKWYRRDDSIDYYLAATQVFPHRAASWYKISDTNFYPYTGFTDIKTGSRVVNPYADMIHDVFTGRLEEPLLGMWIDDLCCETIEDVRARFVHAIPGTLKSFIQYSKLFNHSSTIYQLKPMIYSFWS